MAKEFAKSFYKSKAWKNCRDAYFNSQNGICELCGKPGKEVHHKMFLTPKNINDPNITLNWDNLQVLCSTCHCAIHDKSYEMYRARTRRNTGTMNGLCFDKSGNLVENKNVFIVWGAPASGKNTYVKRHKGKYDLVVDLDLIIASLSMTNGKTVTEDYLPFALDIRELLYSLIERRTYFFEKAWVIATLPKKDERLKLQHRLKAELIYIDTPKEECIERARRDDERPNKDLQFRIINKFFDQLQP